MICPIAIARSVPEPVPTVHIDWNLGTLCNFRCSYCPERLHDGKLKWPDVDLATRFCRYVADHYESLGRKTSFKFTGGEPTLYKHLIDLLRAIRAMGGCAGVNSNASREVRWWDLAARHLDFAVLTHHAEFSDTAHFVAVIERLLACGVKVRVNVTMLPKRFDDCSRTAHALHERCGGIGLALKPLLVDFGTRMYAYTHEQKEAMKRAPFLAAEDEPSGGMRCDHADGSSHVCEAHDFILRNENHWSGWWCNAGIESLAVAADGEIYHAVCREQGSLGNLRDAAPRLPVAPIRCAKRVCACLADIKISKWRRKVPAA